MSIFKKLGLSRFLKKDVSKKDETKKVVYEPIGIDYISTFYKHDETNIQFIRIVNDAINVRKIEGTINFDSFYNTNQIITSNETLKEFNKEEFEMNMLNKGYRNKFREQKDEVLFLQLQPTIGTELEALDIRQNIELKLGNVFRKNKIGQWIASDLGPGGANILFETSNWDKAFETVTSYINYRGLIKEIVIAKRLDLSDEDWNYEIVFPIDYNGTFNQM